MKQNNFALHRFFCLWSKSGPSDEQFCSTLSVSSWFTLFLHKSILLWFALFWQNINFVTNYASFVEQKLTQKSCPLSKNDKYHVWGGRSTPSFCAIQNCPKNCVSWGENGIFLSSRPGRGGGYHDLGFWSLHWNRKTYFFQILPISWTYFLLKAVLAGAVELVV